ncbi:MAG: hypothetical protein RSC68_33965 [Acinetobacter sp.]
MKDQCKAAVAKALGKESLNQQEAQLIEQRIKEAKPVGGKLLFVKRGEIELPSLTLAKQQVSDWEMTSRTSDRVGTAIVYWHDKKGAKKHEVKVGDGEPVKRLRHIY